LLEKQPPTWADTTASFDAAATTTTSLGTVDGIER